MSDLSGVERALFERVFGMSSGYVLDFTNNTFAEFVSAAVGVDIYDPKYALGESKANRLRGFWSEAPNALVAALLEQLLEYAEAGQELDPKERDRCRRAIDRLRGSDASEDFDAVAADLSGPAFEVIIRSVRGTIERGEFEEGLDRLHTFTTKYIRELAMARGCDASRDKPLHSIFGEYVKALTAERLVDSDMVLRILKSTIGTMEAFNDVRNNRSLAHDNPLLGPKESILIFSHVCAALKFIRDLEEQSRQEGDEHPDASA